MIVCEKCFCDTEIISVIRNKEDIGNWYAPRQEDNKK